MALHDVPTQPCCHGDRTLRIHPFAGDDEPQRAAIEYLPHDLASKVSPAVEITVRQTPLTAIESPCPASAPTSGPRTVSTAPSPYPPNDLSPRQSSTIPVNTIPRTDVLTGLTTVRGTGSARTL